MEETKFNPAHMHAAAMSVLGGSKKKMHMHIEPTDNDGFIVEHHEQGPSDGRIPKHALSSIKDLIQHVKSHYGDPVIDKVKASAVESEAGKTKEPEEVRDSEQS